MQLAESAIDLRDLVGEGRQLLHFGGKLQQAHLVLRAQNGVHKSPRRLRFFGHVFLHAAAGVDSQGQVQRQLRLALKDRDLLRASVL